MAKLRQFFSLYFTNVFGVMNDNVLKSLVCFVAATWVSDEYRSIIVNTIAAAMVIPYVLFSPLAGKLPHFFSKIRIVRIAKICELPIMGVAILGFYFQNLPLAMSACLLMGLQSALFSPSKYGLIKDIGGYEGISMGMGGMEAFSFLGMLIGTFIGSVMAESPQLWLMSMVLVALAGAGLLASITIKAREQEYNEESSANPIRFIIDTAKIVNRQKGLQHVVMFLSLFWWLSASLQIILIVHCPQQLDMTPSQTGYLLATMAIGVTVGCLVAGRINNRIYLLGYTPLLGILIGVFMILAFALPFASMGNSGKFLFSAIMFVISFLGGMFKIPLDAEIQCKSKPSELNIVLAYFNLVSFIFIFAASVTNIAITYFLPTHYVFLFDGAVILVWAIVFFFNYRGVLCFNVRNLIHCHYNFHVEGAGNMDVSDGANLLVLPMHRALLDPMVMFTEFYNHNLQPLVDSRFFLSKPVAHVLSLFDSIQVPDMRRGRDGVEQVQKLDGIVKQQLESGANILFYPSGHITNDGLESIGTRRMAHNAAQNLPANTRVIGIRIIGFWGSQWSNYGRRGTPPLMPLLLKSLWFIVSLRFLFVKKRDINISIQDLTQEFHSWKDLPRQEFNKKLEEFYNQQQDPLVKSWV
ncbi:MAG: MFS transporter [Bacteroidales bacterium]|nr:MFS transporter [Bacteroidales bacterium]